MNDLFLCHTGADKDWTRSLGEKLEERQISGRPVKVFFDEWDIDYGTNIITQIDKGLKESNYVGLVLSPAMVKADWPSAEWQSQVMGDPTGKRGRILPLLYRRFDPDTGAPIELPFILKYLKRFDFTDPKRFRPEFERLLRKISGLPPLRGSKRAARASLGAAMNLVAIPGQDSPDLIEESLPSNLFPLLSKPEHLYSDATPVKKRSEVWNKAKGTTPPFFIFGDRLYSFLPTDAANNPFKPFLTGKDPKPEPTSGWLSDTDKAWQVIGLLNAGLKQHCYRLKIWTPKSDTRLFYPPIFGNSQPRTFSWGSGRPRTLAIIHESKKKGGGEFGVHMAARMRFILLGPKLYLLIEPAWMFTTDGIKPVEGQDMGVFSTKWGGREKNATVLRNVLMWGLLIADGKREIAINIGTETIPAMATIQSVPSHTRINVGIPGDEIRLDRILAGEGAGEQRDETAGDDVQELKKIADLALIGEPSDAGDDGVSAAESLEDEDGEELSLGL